jgi:hypothetical protein
MGKKLLYVLLGLIVAVIVIAECLSYTHVKSQSNRIEREIGQRLEKVFSN